MFEKIQGIIKTTLKRDYAKAIILYVLANIIGQGVVLFSSSLFTRIMSKADYGLVNTYSTWVLVLNTFICLNLFITVRTAYVDFKDDYDNYNSSILFLSITIGIAMSCIICGITQFAGLEIGAYEVLLACVQSVALNVINFSLAVQSMKNEYKKRAFLIIAPNWTHILASIVLMILFSGNLYIAKITGNALGLLLFGIIGAVVYFIKSKPRIIPKYWKYALLISVPSIFVTLSDLLLMQCDRLMLTSMVGAEETAEYSVVYNVSSIIIVIYQAINGAWLPWFFEKVGNDDKETTIKYQKIYLLVFSAFTCSMMTISPELIKILSRNDYWDGIRYASPLAIASYFVFLYAFFTNYLLYKKNTTRIAVNTVIATLLNLMLNYVLIPQYKAVGAVIATAISYALLFILHLLAIWKDGKQYFSISAMMLNLVGIACFGVIVYFVRNIWIMRYSLFIILIILLYITNGKRIMSEALNGSPLSSSNSHR